MIPFVLPIVAAGALALRHAARTGLPRTRGAPRVLGAVAPIELLRDGRGVVTVVAQSLADACFGQGYAHAQDRLWQMELHRRTALGRLAELIGERALPADRFMRRLGLGAAADRELAILRDDERAALTAYAAGVNAAVGAFGRRLPPEFRLLRHRPEPWTPRDTLAWSKAMAFSLGANADGELLRARLLERLGPVDAAALDLAAPDAALDPRGASGAAALAAAYAEAARWLPLGAHGASNAWAIAGARTASGLPIVCSDPHLPLRLPSLWHEVRLVAPGLDVVGGGIPGAPLVLIGRGIGVAWGVTTANADAQDLFIERFDRDGRCQRPDGWAEPTRRSERIRVRGGADRIEEVVETRHGPLLLPPDGDRPGLALRWTGHDPGHLFGALIGMARAADATAFRAALRDWHAPAQNVVYADRASIGWVMAGTVPIRGAGSGFAPVPGWTGEHDWRGSVAFERLPQSVDPACGFIVSANERPAGVAGVSWDFAAPHRAQRIAAVLAASARAERAHGAALQRDVRCAPGIAFARACAAVAGGDAVERAALAALAAWDGEATADSVGAAVYAACALATARAAYAPRLGAALAAELLGRPALDPLAAGSAVLGRWTTALVGALTGRDAAFLRALGHESWDALIAGGIRDGVADLRRRLGDDVATWRWGRLHRVRIRHPFAAMPLIGRWFGGCDAPIGGDTDTVMQTATLPHRPYAAEAAAPSWRFLFDWGSPADPRAAQPGGQSGHPASPRYRDGFAEWLDGGHHPLQTALDELRRRGERLELRPS